VTDAQHRIWGGGGVMTEPIEFRSPDSTTVLYTCGDCGTLYTPMIFGDGGARVQANLCCTPKTCVCGNECASHYAKCRDCLAKAKIEKTERLIATASHVEADTWFGPIYDPEEDEFYSSLGDLYDLLMDDELPRFVHPCSVVSPTINLAQVLESIEEEIDIGDTLDHISWQGVEDLEEHVRKFNGKQTYKIWEPRFSSVIMIGDKVEKGNG
jgi:hypothetical protein